MALLNIRLSDGSLLIQGKDVTGFTNEEEKRAGLDTHVPYLTETELRQRVITGQNPASGGPVADLLLQALAA